MIVSLRESKTNLSRLVSLAESGQEILITVRGKPRARLIGIPTGDKPNLTAWKGKLARLHNKYSTGTTSAKAEDIISGLRGEDPGGTGA
jgi:prevent-host-death family protein